MIDCISKNAYLNNSIIPAEQAQEALFAGKITVYEVIRIINGCPLFINDHLVRLQKSASLLNVKLWYSATQIQSIISEFIHHESITNGNLKLQFIVDNKESLFLLYQSQHSYPTLEMYQNGVLTKTLDLERDNPNAKNVQSFHKVAQSFLKDHNLYEAILVDKNGDITEGSKSNIFFIKGNSVFTALASDVLLGITRQYVIDASKSVGLTVEERKISKKELPTFDAAFISGTSPKILPIKKIDEYSYRTDNKHLQNLISELDEMIQQYIEKHNFTNK